jgi:hypothetical protein
MYDIYLICLLFVVPVVVLLVALDVNVTSDVVSVDAGPVDVVSVDVGPVDIVSVNVVIVQVICVQLHVKSYLGSYIFNIILLLSQGVNKMSLLTFYIEI